MNNLSMPVRHAAAAGSTLNQLYKFGIISCGWRNGDIDPILQRCFSVLLYAESSI
jgi:hypothetical protein